MDSLFFMVNYFNNISNLNIFPLFILKLRLSGYSAEHSKELNEDYLEEKNEGRIYHKNSFYGHMDCYPEKNPLVKR